MSYKLLVLEAHRARAGLLKAEGGNRPHKACRPPRAGADRRRLMPDIAAAARHGRVLIASPSSSAAGIGSTTWTWMRRLGPDHGDDSPMVNLCPRRADPALLFALARNVPQATRP